MEKQRGIGQALFPKVRRQLLAKLFGQKGSRYYLREITKLVQSSPGTVQRELKMLVGAGILTTEKVGRHQYYQADPNCMIYAELRSIVMKTFGVADAIKAAVSPLADRLQIAMVFGSVATGADTGTSDIDLLVIGRMSFRELACTVSTAEEELGRSINPVLFSQAEFREKYFSDNHFVRTVMKSEKIFIKGTADDLAKLVEEQVAQGGDNQSE